MIPTEKEIIENSYKGYLLKVGYHYFMTVTRDHTGRRIPLFTTEPKDARIYQNEDNAKTIFQWLLSWYMDNKFAFGPYRQYPKIEETIIRTADRNVKWEEDDNGQANSN